MIAAVLAKGGSERMGGAVKPLLEIGGRALLERAIRTAEGCAARVVVVTNHPDILRWCAARGVEAACDAAREVGPLGGLLAALALANPDPVIVLGADMPYLEPALLRRIAHAAGEADAAVPWIGGRAEPLCAAYGPAALPAALDLLAAPGPRGLCALLDRLRVRWLDEGAIGWVPGCRWFEDVDTWEAYQALAEGRGSPEAGRGAG